MDLAAAQQNFDQAFKECRSPDDNVRLKACTIIIEKSGVRSAVKLGEAFDGRCWALHVQGRFDAAISDCQRAISLRPNYHYAYVNLGAAFLGAKDYLKAIAAYNKALELKSTSTWSLNGRGQAYSSIGKYDLASADFRRVLELNPLDDEARTRLSKIEALVRAPIVAKQTASATPNLEPSATSPSTRKQLALVIGNSAYQNFPRLENPGNDAEDTSRLLKERGFEVIKGVNLSRLEMESVLAKFGQIARSVDTALVYYAGHGLQHLGVNYLVPIDATLTDETDLRKFFKLQDVIGDLQGASKIRILIVDACRDNDAIQQLASSLPKSRSAAFARGLAKTEADGTLVVFATQSNKVASDGGGRNSPFTAAFLARMRQPSVDLRVLMARVRADVVEATKGTQRPEVWDSLIGEFAFAAQN